MTAQVNQPLIHMSPLCTSSCQPPIWGGRNELDLLNRLRQVEPHFWRFRYRQGSS